MPFARRKSRKLWLGPLSLGGDAPIRVQSMNASPSHDVEGNIRELRELAAHGCEISRIAIPDHAAAVALQEIARQSPIPIVADIHFDYRLALEAMESGAMALRLNPGNIHSREGLKEVAREAKTRGIPIRVGVNGGSLDSRYYAENGLTAESLCQSALDAAALLEEEGFQDICLSLKASSPALCIEAYREVAALCDYPLHIGVTETGTLKRGLVRSAVGIGTLLAEGIGDTIRVSLTSDPLEEIRAGWEILSSLQLRQRGPRLISCPGCGRTAVNLREMAEKVDLLLEDVEEDMTIAVMGCAVNGPGEAREADLGIAGGRGEYLLFRSGEILRKYPEEEAFERLKEEIHRLSEQKKRAGQ